MPTVDDVLMVGEANARKAKDIGAITGLTVRGVTLAVRELIKEGVPVASSKDSVSGGYYITETREEALGQIHYLRSHIIELAKRMRDYKRASRTIRQPGQLVLL